MSRAEEQPNPIESATRRMADPSWFMLTALIDGSILPSIGIASKVEDMYARADYPIREILPATVHYALERLQKMDLIETRGNETVDVPGPHGSILRQPRDLYQITDLGRQVMVHRVRLFNVISQMVAASDSSNTYNTLQEGNRTPREIVNVKLDKPFGLPQRFHLTDPHSDAVIVSMGEIDLNIEGVGQGRLKVLRIVDDGQWIGRIRTPLGPIEVKYARRDNIKEAVPESHPLSIEIDITEPTVNSLKAVSCGIVVGETVFPSAPLGEFATQERPDGSLYTMFDYWIDPSTNEGCQVWFPQDPGAEAIKQNIQFVISASPAGKSSE